MQLSGLDGSVAPAPTPTREPQSCSFKPLVPPEPSLSDVPCFADDSWEGSLPPVPGEGLNSSEPMPVPVPGSLRQTFVPPPTAGALCREPSRPLGPMDNLSSRLAYHLLLFMGGIYSASYRQPLLARRLLRLWSYVVLLCSALCTAMAAWFAWRYGAGEAASRPTALLLAAHALSRAARTFALWALQRQDWRQLTAQEGAVRAAASAYQRLGLFCWLQMALWVLPLLALVGVVSIFLQGRIDWTVYETSGSILSSVAACGVEALGTVPFVGSLIVIFGAVDGAGVRVSEASRKAVASLSLSDIGGCARLGPSWLSLGRDLKHHCLRCRVPVFASLLALGLSAAASGLDVWVHQPSGAPLDPAGSATAPESSLRYRASELLYCLLWSLLLLTLLKALVSVNEAAVGKFVRPLEQRLEDLPDQEPRTEVRGVERAQAALLLIVGRPLGWFVTRDVPMTPTVFKVVLGSLVTNGGARILAWLARRSG